MQQSPSSHPRSSRRALSWLLAIGAGGLASSLTWEAAATPDYPGALDATVQSSCGQPLSRCLICHTTARGGQGTAVQPFARALRMYGLTRGRDSGLLRDALMRLPEDTDSDEDGITDKEELRDCDNPSGADLLSDAPEYGCDGARLAPSAPTQGSFWGVALASAALLVRPRRRRAAQA